MSEKGNYPMDDAELRMECLRIASDNLRDTGMRHSDMAVTDYAVKLVNFVRGTPPKLEKVA